LSIDPGGLQPRHFLPLCGTQALCLRAAARQVSPGVPVFWLTDQEPAAIQALIPLPSATLALHVLPARKAPTLLGQDCGLLVFDAFSGFDVNAFAAVSGTLVGGGTLILLSPPWAEWAGFPDPDYRRFLPWPYTLADVQGRFLARLVRWLPQAPWSRSGVMPADGLDAASADLPGVPVAWSENAPWAGAANTGSPTPDQQSAVEAILQAAAPLTLMADRGRGKSAVLGMAATRLLQQGRTPILCAPSRQTAVNVFRHADPALPFCAPDELLQTLPVADVLLVDEAAAIPVPLLARMVQHYPHSVFATTVHGYEGSGRGFVLRFQTLLAQQAPGWQALQLEKPLRWAVGDALERWLNRVLLLDVEVVDTVPANRAVAGVQAASVGMVPVRLARERLAQDESLLQQVFGLLVTAHYQTRPSDLRQLLDAPDLSVHTLLQNERVLAVAVLSREGGFDPALAQAIHAGQRRPHGHPVPQTLCFHAGLLEAALLHCERIMRIAVHPEYQRHGLGCRLLAYLQQYARQQGADYLGVSYALTPGMQAFWARAGFVLARIGQKRDRASGCHSAVSIRPLTAAGQGLAARCQPAPNARSS